MVVLNACFTRSSGKRAGASRSDSHDMELNGRDFELIEKETTFAETCTECSM